MSYMYDKFVLAVHGNVTETLVRQPEGERAVATCARKCLKQEDCVAFDLIATSAGQPSCRLHNVEKLDTDDWPDNVVRQVFVAVVVVFSIMHRSAKFQTPPKCGIFALIL